MTDKKLTDSEIVKGLECCAVPLPHFKCNECPAWVNSHCILKNEDLIDLFNRLQEENEKLNIRLRKTEHQFADIGKMHSVIKAEAYKEFAERVKMAFYYHFDELIPSIMADEINNLLKELVGE